MQNTEIVQVIKDSGLEESTANFIKNKFVPFLEAVEDLKKSADNIEITNVSQKKEMLEARELRLKFKEIRV